MGVHVVQPVDRGCALDPPRLRVYRSAVVAGRGAPGWSQELVEAYWSAQKITWAVNGNASTAILKVQLGQSADREEALHAESSHCSAGDRIRIVQLEGDREIEWFRGHIAQDALLIQANDDLESFSVTAYGPELLLAHYALSGPWWPTTSLDATEIQFGQGAGADQLTYAQAVRAGAWASYAPVIFNPQISGAEGRGNASGSLWKLTRRGKADGGYDASAADSKCRVFAAPGRRVVFNNGTSTITTESRLWTPYEAVRSLIEYIDDYTVVSFAATAWPAIEALLSGMPLGTVDLTGCNLAEALNKILLPLGFGFCLEPWASADGRHALKVFRLHDPLTHADAFLAKIGTAIESPDGQRSAVQRLNVIKDHHNVRNDIILLGGVKHTQRTLTFTHDADTRDLHPYWDQTTNALADYADASNRIRPKGAGMGAGMYDQWKQRYEYDGDKDLNDAYRHAFRSFVWNEDAALSALVKSAQNNALIPDFSANHLAAGGLSGEGFDNLQTAHVPRPMRYRAEYADGSDAQSGSLKPAAVEVAVAEWDPDAGAIAIDDQSWVELGGDAVELRNDRCGIWIKAKNLLDLYPWKDIKSRSSTGPFGTDPSVSLHQRYGRWNWPTLLHNAMRKATGAGEYHMVLRMSGMVPMDSHVMFQAPRQQDSSWPFTAQEVVIKEDFRYRDKLGEASQTMRATVNDGQVGGRMDLYSRRVRDVMEDAVAHGSVVLRGLHRSFSPGQGLATVRGRGVDLTVAGRTGDTARRIAPVIVAVSYLLEESANKTELVLDTPLVRTIR
ncbi:MAG: hypothetical protein ABFD92_00095 [Planctomycetaceae bacterium]|nr:hypothetical protein [Planctomycetaceae bacterium]